jgi:hypothetical protein
MCLSKSDTQHHTNCAFECCRQVPPLFPRWAHLGCCRIQMNLGYIQTVLAVFFLLSSVDGRKVFNKPAAANSAGAAQATPATSTAQKCLAGAQSTEICSMNPSVAFSTSVGSSSSLADRCALCSCIIQLPAQCICVWQPCSAFTPYTSRHSMLCKPAPTLAVHGP